MFLESSVQIFLIPTANLLIIPEILFCLVLIVSPQWWYELFPHGAEDSHLLQHYLQMCYFLFWCYDDTRLSSKSSENFCCLPLSPFNCETTWRGDGSKFSWSSKSPTCSGSKCQRCREIRSSSKWTEFRMVSTTGGIAEFEERLGS